MTAREGCNFPALCRRSKPGPCEKCQRKNKRDADTAKRAAKQRRPSLRRAG
jgi:hypothetical protein